jgi:hypothetical protein
LLSKNFQESLLNGNYVSPRLHALTDPHRKLRGMTKADTIAAPLRYILRVPTVYAYPTAIAGVGANVAGKRD